MNHKAKIMTVTFFVILAFLAIWSFASLGDFSTSSEPAVQPEPEPAVQPEPEPAVQPEPEPAVQPEPEPDDLFPIRYYVDDSASKYRDNIVDAFNSWKELNPDFDFYELEHPVPSALGIFAREQLDANGIGYYEVDEVRIENILTETPRIYFEFGNYDCNGNFILFESLAIQKIMEHEIGHHLGLDHVSDKAHLMHDDTGIPFDLYDDLDYNIPYGITEFRFVGQQELSYEIDEMENKLNPNNKTSYNSLVDEINILIAKKNCYPNIG